VVKAALLASALLIAAPASGQSLAGLPMSFSCDSWLDGDAQYQTLQAGYMLGLIQSAWNEGQYSCSQVKQYSTGGGHASSHDVETCTAFPNVKKISDMDFGTMVGALTSRCQLDRKYHKSTSAQNMPLGMIVADWLSTGKTN
jgi:hypothetical protein